MEDAYDQMKHKAIVKSSGKHFSTCGVMSGWHKKTVAEVFVRGANMAGLNY